jgi:hypothetical protein
VAALISWVVVVSILNIALRHLITGYAAGEPTFAFTTGMLAARLVIAALSSPPQARWPLRSRLSNSGPPASQVRFCWRCSCRSTKLWTAFPLWYHLTLLVTLIPLVIRVQPSWPAGTAWQHRRLTGPPRCPRLTAAVSALILSTRMS